MEQTDLGDRLRLIDHLLSVVLRAFLVNHPPVSSDSRSSDDAKNICFLSGNIRMRLRKIAHVNRIHARR